MVYIPHQVYLFGIQWNPKTKNKYLLRFYFDNLFYKTVNVVPLTSKISIWSIWQGSKAMFFLIELLQICEISSRSLLALKLRKELVFLF